MSSILKYFKKLIHSDDIFNDIYHDLYVLKRNIKDYVMCEFLSDVFEEEVYGWEEDYYDDLVEYFQEEVRNAND